MQIFWEFFGVAVIDGFDIDLKRGDLAATKMMGYGDKDEETYKNEPAWDRLVI